jgi:hypothetical protein
MRVLVADIETEMLEAIARAFEVDVATSERLSDGSGLELLSHVGQRWPQVLRILAIEPSRRQMLRGRLGPFRLFDTIAYPIDDAKLEAALMRAQNALTSSESDAAESEADLESDVPAKPPVVAPPVATPPRESRSNAVKQASVVDARKAAPRVGRQSSLPEPTNLAPEKPAAIQRIRRNDGATFPPLPAKGSKIVPLGSPAAPGYRILPHDYHSQTMPGTLKQRRADDRAKPPPTLQEKAAALAAGAMGAVVRLIKPQSSPPPRPRVPPTAPSNKKR